MAVIIGGTAQGGGGSPGSGLMATLAQGYIFGLTLSNNAGDATNDIDIATGVARDGSDAFDLTLLAATTKRLDANFSAGSGGGGLDTGAKANSTWYHVWLIRKDSDGTSDVLFSTSATAPTMPSGYTAKRRIGAILTTGAGVIFQFYQIENEFHWKDLKLDVNGITTLGATPTNFTLSVPLGVRTHVVLSKVLAGNAAAGTRVGVYSPEDTDESGASVDTVRVVVAGQNNNLGPVVVGPTNTSSQVRAVSTAATTTFSLFTRGWIDPRGRWV